MKGYLGYFEIDDDDYATRYLEIRPNGIVVRYTKEFGADEFGVLPECRIEDDEVPDPEYGIFIPICAEVFETIWKNTICCNRPPE